MSGCLGTSRGSSPTTSTTPHVRLLRHVTRHVARLFAPLVVDYFTSRRLVVDYFAYATRPVASARRATCRVTHCRLLRLTQARRRLLRLRCAAGCLGSSRGSSRGPSSTTLTMPCVRVLRHVGRLIALLVVDYATCPVASARRAARRASRRSARRRLLRLAQAPRRLPHLRRASGCFGTLRSLSRDSS
jgi:hypothetical protein